MILYLIQKQPMNGTHKHKRPRLSNVQESTCHRSCYHGQGWRWRHSWSQWHSSRLPLSWNWQVAIVVYICLTYVVLLLTSVTLYIMYTMYVYFRLSKTSLQVPQINFWSSRLWGDNCNSFSKYVGSNAESKAHSSFSFCVSFWDLTRSITKLTLISHFQRCIFQYL
jgi:hypothetical protein